MESGPYVPFELDVGHLREREREEHTLRQLKIAAHRLKFSSIPFMRGSQEI